MSSSGALCQADKFFISFGDEQRSKAQTNKPIQVAELWPFIVGFTIYMGIVKNKINLENEVVL